MDGLCGEEKTLWRLKKTAMKILGKQILTCGKIAEKWFELTVSASPAKL